MSETSDEAGKYDSFCSKLNDKPVDAIGHINFHLDLDHLKPPFNIEKAFGLIVKEPNLVLKFRLIVKNTDQKRIKFKLIYISEERIECKFEESQLKKQVQKSLIIGDTLVKLVCRPDNKKLLSIDSLVIGFSIGLNLDTKQMKGNFVSRKFNEHSSSDFIIECQNKKFHVHQIILKDESEYFEAILGNDFKEKKGKKDEN